MSDEFEIYRVKEGDTLHSIAKKKYGIGALWRILYQDNKYLIGDEPGHIRPGQRLNIRKKIEKGEIEND